MWHEGPGSQLEWTSSDCCCRYSVSCSPTIGGLNGGEIFSSEALWEKKQTPSPRETENHWNPPRRGRVSHAQFPNPPPPEKTRPAVTFHPSEEGNRGVLREARHCVRNWICETRKTKTAPSSSEGAAHWEQTGLGQNGKKGECIPGRCIFARCSPA